MPAPERPAPDRATGARPRLEGWMAAAVVVAVVAPVAAAGLAGWRAEWAPAGDWAVLELAVRDVGSADTPLVGPYSRYGWNHPGPLLFWAMALPYRLTGASSPSLLAAAAAVNVAALGGTLWLAWRRGRLALVALVGAALASVTWSSGGELLRDPWNPWVTPLAFGVLVVAAWSAGEGDRPALVASVVVGSFLAQSHVGFGPLVAACLVWAFAGCWRAARHDGRAGGTRRVVALAAGTLAACWVPVALDVVRGGPNLSRLVDHFGEGGDRAGWGEALGLAARQLELLGPWSGGDEPVRAVGGTVEGAPLSYLVVPVVVFGVAALLARRAGAVEAVRLQGLVALCALVGVASVAQISDGVYGYLIRWWWPLAALWWASIGWSLWSAALVRWEDRTARSGAPPRWEIGRWAVLGLGALALVVAGRDGWSVVRDLPHQALPAQDWQQPLDEVVPPAVAAVAGQGVVTVHADGPLSGWAFDAVVLQLDRAGVPFVVHDGGVNAHKFGPRRLTGEPSPPELWVVTGPAADEAAARDGAEVVASWDRLDPADRRAIDGDHVQLAGLLRAAGRDDLVEALERGDTLPPEVVPADVPVELVERVNEDLEALPALTVVVVRDGAVS